MEKINIAELLKNCPTGMELDCTIVGGLYFDEVTENNMIKCYTKRYYEPTSTCNSIYFYSDGSYLNHTKAKCVIFPKGKSTWEGFVPPSKFKDGDVITCTNNICTFVAIYQSMCGENAFYRYVCLILNERMQFSPKNTCSDFSNPRLATEEEKQKLFDAIKEHGYKWNPETKTLEKIKTCLNCKTFKDMHQNCPFSPIWNCKDLNKAKSRLRDEANCKFWTEIPETKTLENKKFDINTLKPFDKVLVRGNVGQKWIIDFFGFMDKDKGYPFCMCSYYISQCIPYEGNQHLLGTTDACSDYFKTWE